MALNQRDSRAVTFPSPPLGMLHSNSANNSDGRIVDIGYYGPEQSDRRYIVDCSKQHTFPDGKCTGNQSTLGILIANPNHVDSKRAASPLSSTSTNCQTAAGNQNSMGFESPSCHNFPSWSEGSPQRETSTEKDGETSKDGRWRNQLENGSRAAIVASGSSDQEQAKTSDSKDCSSLACERNWSAFSNIHTKKRNCLSIKLLEILVYCRENLRINVKYKSNVGGLRQVLRRLAQNREAARKSRLRKKAYVQQLESSRVKLNQLEQELERVRQQGMHASGFSRGDQNPSVVAFDMDYKKWVEEHNRQVNELRSALTADASDSELHTLVDHVMSHYDQLFQLKGAAVKADAFHVVSGMWKTPAERCFMWIGGFRPSQLLKLMMVHLEPLTEQQVVAVGNLQQSCQEAEEALSQGMDALQQSLAEILSSGSLGTPNVANYMGQMALAMGKLSTLENFVCQADSLRQQTLQRMYGVLSSSQGARGLLAIHDYFSRLRALSSLWIARPHD